MLRGTAFAQYNTICAQQKADSRNINLHGKVCAQYRPDSRNKNRGASDCAQLPDWHFLSLLGLHCPLQRIAREPRHFADYDAAFVRSLVNSGFRFGGRLRSKLHVASGSLKRAVFCAQLSSALRFTAGKPLLLSDARDERVAIIGSSGSGKSTLARLLVRGADPGRGRILLERQPLSEYRLESLRSAVCYVPQHPVLFQGNIRENLLYANPQATVEEIYRAINAAQFASVLDRLPNDIDTPLGPGAVSLSGGERQRLAIARSLVRNAAVLILDEATSALDGPTEREVLRSVAGFHRHQTIIAISHRIKSLGWVDRFVLLDQGHIVATGAHSILFAQSALYRSLFGT
jgi:ABC-type multidrug transport system ATPase subunit